MTYFLQKESYFKWTIFLILAFGSTKSYSQCAGTDNSVTVCNKDTDENNKTFDLFAQLGGTPTPGGTWSTNDPANFFALDRNTGIVNLWDVKNSGFHEFTYTNDACGESAVITVILGGYPGEDNIDGSADACGDNPAVNLHSFIGDETDGKFQDFNGTWAAVTPGAGDHLTQNFFNAADAGVGIYEFTHTVPAVGTCPSRQVSLILEVQRPANSGVGSALTVCNSEDLSGMTNYNLNTLLMDEDINGTWSEGPSTHQLDDLTDNTVDVQAIRDNNGPGTYTFTYTVYPSHAVCTISQTSVDIIILPTLQGTMAATNFCAGPTEYRVVLDTYNTSLIEDGTYGGNYSLSSLSGTFSATTSIVLANNGTGYFDIDASTVPMNEVITISIESLGAEVCPDIQVPPVDFIVTDPNAMATDSCIDSDIPISLSNIYDASLSLAQGNYDVDYTITDSDNTDSNFSMPNVAFSSGSASFDIPSTQLPEAGSYDISFTVQSGFTLGCDITSSFNVVPPPTNIVLDLGVDNSCNATQIDVQIDAPNLADGDYNITYDVVSQSTGLVVLENTINFTGGTASYDLDVASLEQGNYTVSVRSIQDDTTACRTTFEFEESENFAIEGIPALPVAEENQNFCLNEFSGALPTLADIEVSANGEILFYATESDMDILPLDTELVDGANYFISNTDPNNNCEGSDRIRVVVNLLDPVRPMAVDTNPTFCASEQATVLDLNPSVSANGTITWYANATGGSPLDNTTLLVDGTSYFAANTEPNGCSSTDRVEIVPTVYGLEPASLEFTILSLCGLDNPTINDLRSIEGDNPYEVLWYDTPEEGNPLDDQTLLQSETTYYAVSFNPDTGCMNPERNAVTVDLTNCDPEDYGFFIPDGFSPNGDGRNDSFFVPNIEIIFPEFTLEILNRYGATLFKGDRSNPAWDGSEEGKTAPNGVYFYVINYNKDGHQPIQGRLYLNR
ncbi:gliding motility-associated C-terminal domain-containing protein [Euzebyella saccharophila]|uniref:Gliding motility-associated C-terminal domain-containing protein n=1 Tax=Euzebyella saccharophila TaxID=679664 RepID=A0ABV8JTE4_9FLAO|nr:gliding motility-associated C-terminal domain-containing protein [Euzebyella saccharophila]